MKKILITNDDGIYSDGIIRLATAAKAYGQVWVIAPDDQRSAMSHSVTLRREIEVWSVDFPVEGVMAYACDAQPADCVRVGVHNVVPGGADYVFSGINYGYNVATDLQYSATAGAAFEAAFQGIPAIAFSEDACENHEVTDRYLSEIMKKLMDMPLNRKQIWNVNFPGGSPSECGGVLYDRSVSSEEFYKDKYNERIVADGKKAYMVEGIRNYEATEGTDLKAVLSGFVSVGVATNIS